MLLFPTFIVLVLIKCTCSFDRDVLSLNGFIPMELAKQGFQDEFKDFLSQKDERKLYNNHNLDGITHSANPFFKNDTKQHPRDFSSYLTVAHFPFSR